jgi:hypothetical protein
MHGKKRSIDTKHAFGHSSNRELLKTAKDTFSNSSVNNCSTDEEVFQMTRKVPPVHPGPRAPRVELLEYIKQQLDCYGKKPLLMNRYQLLGPDQRATGGLLPQ